MGMSRAQRRNSKACAAVVDGAGHHKDVRLVLLASDGASEQVDQNAAETLCPVTGPTDRRWPTHS
ncbi:hypothetical protein ACFWAR_26520 [Streptomyces sp. NPDC059917]|uniref:hypothetical protein n=1 Tax=Streptomyces sp. NPDC059917 TaxID=3347002 RepID=UPI0036635C68